MGFASKEQLQDLMEFMGNNIHVPQLVQHFDGNNIYSTEEFIVGCWLDGRPIYKKSIIKTVPEGGSTGSSITINLSDEIPNLGTVVTEKVMARAANSNNAHMSPVYNGTFSELKFEHSRYAANNEVKYTLTNHWSVSVEVYLIVQYTKTTDAVNSYNIAKENTYNLTEKVVGKWVDGSTLYQKTIEMGALTNAVSTEATKTVVHGISNLGKVVSASGHWYLTANPSTGGTVPYSDKNYYISALTQSGNNVAVNYKGDWSTATVFVTLQYTKTS